MSDSSQPRIVITRDYTWKRLVAEIEQGRGTNFIIVGLGARSRRLLDRVIREFPDAAVRLPISDLNPRTHVVAMLWGDQVIAMGNVDTGAPPVVEVMLAEPG